MRNATLTVAMLTLVSVFACRRPVAESSECVFHAPETLARIEGRMIDPTPLFWRGADRDALLLQDGTAQNGRAHAWRVDVRTGAVTEDAIAIVDDPRRGPVPAPDYIRFRAEREDYAPLPLLRTDLKGSTQTTWTPQWSPSQGKEGGWKSGSISTTDGTWRVVFGDKTLLERTYRNAEIIPTLRDAVSIDPDGKLLVCTCADLRGTWIAIHDINNLTRGAAAGAPRLEK